MKFPDINFNNGKRFLSSYLRYFSYIITMDLPIEFYEILIPVSIISVALVAVHFLTKGSRNFRSSRNKKARKQF